MNNTDKKNFVIPIVFFFFLCSFCLIYISLNTDLGAHVRFARSMSAGEIPYSGNFLFYWLVNVFSFFGKRVFLTVASLCFLLATASTIRYYLAQNYINKILNLSNNNEYNYWTSVIIALSLMFVFVIPFPSIILTNSFYGGNFVPNIWHNSTTIFLFPFAILLFYFSYKQLIDYENKRNILIVFLVALNIFIKPSFFFVIAFIYPFFLLVKYKLSERFWISIIPIAFGLLLLFFEFVAIYRTNNQLGSESSSIVIKPFYVYTVYSKLSLLPLSLIFSLFFPIVYTLFNYKKIINTWSFWYTLVSFIFSIAIFLLLTETGPRATHGNFYWQVVISSWLCFFVTIASLLKDSNFKSLTNKEKFLFGTYSLHILLGIVYFFRLFISKTYW